MSKNSKKNEDSKIDTKNTLTLQNELNKLRIMLETELMYTFHMHFHWIDIYGRILDDKKSAGIAKYGVDEYNQHVKMEQYWLRSITQRRDRFNKYITGLMTSFNLFNEYPTNLYTHYARRAYLNQFIAYLKCMLGEIANMKAEFKGTDLNAYEKYIRQCKVVKKLAEGIRGYDNQETKKAEKQFFEKSGKREVLDLYKTLEYRDNLEMLGDLISKQENMDIPTI